MNGWQEQDATAPAINVIENEKDYKVELAAPGMTKNDFKVSVDEKQQSGNLHGKERTRRRRRRKTEEVSRAANSPIPKFQQSILLPENVEKDKISAKVEHGILSIDNPENRRRKKDQKTFKAIEVK